MNKYAVLIPYKKTKDNGKELRYALRSLKNLRNWNGDVFVVGDREDWFQNITSINVVSRHHNPYQDAETKIHAALVDPRLPDDFIFSNDDIYVTEPVTLRPFHRGELGSDRPGYYHKAKQRTADWLREQGIDMPLDYGIHVPMLMNKKKRLEVHHIIKDSFRGIPLQARSVYGNLFNVGGDMYEDKKTKTIHLKEGVFISTQFYTDELQKLFPRKCKFEAYK